MPEHHPKDLPPVGQKPTTKEAALTHEEPAKPSKPTQDVPAGHEGLDPQYPTNPPAAAIDAVINRLRGQGDNPAAAIHAAWILQGYALSKFSPDEHPQVMRVQAGPYSKERVISLLEDAKRQGVAARPAIEWVRVAQAVMNMNLLWLSGQEANP